jgi:hypothetical protein
MNLMTNLKERFHEQLLNIESSDYCWEDFWLDRFCENQWWKFETKDLTIDHLNELLRVSEEGIKAGDLNPPINVDELLANYGRWFVYEDNSFKEAFEERIFELEKEEREQELDEEDKKSESESESEDE